MGNAAEVRRMTAAEFLAWDAGQSVRHEFVGGEVFAMAGGEDRQATVTLRLGARLLLALSGTPCRVYVQDVKLLVAADRNVYYPDVFVTCSAADAADRLVKREPRFVAEILSKSTAGFNRGARFASYRRLPTLQEYLLVDIEDRCADLFRKGADGLWVLHPAEPGALIALQLGCEIAVDELFADLEGDDAA